MTTDNFYLQNRLILTSQTGGQQYSDTSPFSITCFSHWVTIGATTFSIATLSIMGSLATLGINDIDCRYVECHDYLNVMLASL